MLGGIYLVHKVFNTILDDIELDIDEEEEDGDKMIKELLYTVFIVGSFALIVDLIMWNRQKRIDEENSEQKDS